MSILHSKSQKEFSNKIIIFLVGSGLVAFILIARLFQLQVLANDYYEQIAAQEQFGYSEIPAQRGEIIIKDAHSDEEFLLATNTTLNLLYADPTLIKDPAYVVEKLFPLIFNLEEERATDAERITKLGKTLSAETPPEEMQKLLTPYTDDQLKQNFKDELIKKISAKKRTQIILAENLENSKIAQIQNLHLSGTEVIKKTLYVYPSQLTNPSEAAEALSPIVEITPTKLAKIFEGKNRYVVIKTKLNPDISDKIQKIIKDDKKLKAEKQQFNGLGMKEESFRYYPEGSLAASIVGYVSRSNIGQYGIESSFNNSLQGVDGKFETKKDSVGRQITVGESVLKPAVNGDDIVLTIDRSVQLQAEKLLEQGVKDYRADSAQAIVMNPKTGAIIAMATYPNFNPNSYGDVFKKVEINLSPSDINNLDPTKTPGTYYFYVNREQFERYVIFEEKDENGISKYYRYANYQGPEVYHNKVVSWPYEPGSVFKTIIMAMAIDDGDVTPNTTFNDSGPIKVDYNIYTNDYDFEIKNSENRYLGLVSMTTVLAQSLNTGMTFIAKKIGPALMYSYLQKFGILDRTDIEFENEGQSKIEYFTNWTESELATHAFGQGLTVTMIQLANAYSAIVNGGVLMQPHIIEEIRHDDGTITATEPREIRRVISEETSAKMRTMLIETVENGVSKGAKIDNHQLGGKSGTAQTYGNGKALSGKGTTIASFCGFGPVDDPQFVILVKYDRPRSSEWGGNNAAPTVGLLAQYLFDYYNIAPDK